MRRASSDFDWRRAEEESGSARVYWPTLGAPGEIHSVGLEGGSETTLAANQQFPAAVAVDDAYVYWVDSNPNAGAVMKAPK